MSQWKQFDLAEKVREILSSVVYDHHFGGRPYLTVFQIAIDLANRWPADTSALGKEMGGANSGAGGYSLPLCVGNRLSVEIRDGNITDIEGSFLGNLNLREISFVAPDGSPIVSSLTGSQFPVSIYCLKD